MTRSFQYTIIWLMGSFVASLMCLNSVSGSLVDGQYIPVGNDSFYHARRILDTVAQPDSFYEFDKKIHAPEGSLLTWPWGYDYLMATIVRTALAIGIAADPMTILSYLPAAATTISIGLIVGISFVLQLSPWATALAVLCVTFSPVTQALHGVGVIDHHFVEALFALAAFLTGLAWMRSPSSWYSAIIAGTVLGIAPAFQNGLFILQLPLIACIGWMWLIGTRLPPKSAYLFSIALMSTTFLVLLPSTPFREGAFEFYLLSWFHLYIAACSTLVVLLTAFLKRSKKALIAVFGIGLLSILPIVHQIILGGDFLAAQLEPLPTIAETKNLPLMIDTWGLKVVMGYYGPLIVLWPLSVAGCLWYLCRPKPEPQLVLFCITCSFGLVLLSLQFRLHVFGYFALFLPLILTVDRRQYQAGNVRLIAMGALTLVLFTSSLISIRGPLFERKSPGNDNYYALSRGIYPMLKAACARNPGVVLAGSDNGHYIRFHSECSVIGNNFLITSQHIAKYQEVRRLMAFTSSELLKANTGVKYVLVTMGDIASERANAELTFDKPQDWNNLKPQLVADLLIPSIDTIDKRYRLLLQLKYEDHAPFARLFEILPLRRLTIFVSS